MPKGHTNNPNGRPVGASNKIPTAMRIWLRDFLEINKGSLQEAWDALEPRDKVAMFEKLLKYSLPQLQAITITEQPQQQMDYSKLTDDELATFITLSEKAKASTPQPELEN